MTKSSSVSVYELSRIVHMPKNYKNKKNYINTKVVLLKATNRTNSKYVCTYVLKKWKSTHKKTIMYSAIATTA